MLVAGALLIAAALAARGWSASRSHRSAAGRARVLFLSALDHRARFDEDGMMRDLRASWTADPTYLPAVSEAVAFHDINPQAPVHLLIVPRKHIPTLLDLQGEDFKLIGHIYEIAGQLAREFKLEPGFRIISNCNAQGGQSVYHIHFHLLGGRFLTWPPG